MKTLGGMSEEEVGRRWDGTVAIFREDGWENPGVAIVQRATKHLLPGDVVILAFSNGGGQRQPAWCRTRKGRCIRRLFVEFANFENDAGDMEGRRARAPHHCSTTYGRFTQHNDRSTVFLLEPPPGGNDGAWPPLPDAAVRRYVVESTRAWHAARRVSANSPAQFIREGGGDANVEGQDEDQGRRTGSVRLQPQPSAPEVAESRGPRERTGPS